MMTHTYTQSDQKKRLECRIYVGSISYALTEEDIKVPFATFGKIVRVDMPREPGTMRSKGFCFIEYDNPDSAKAALSTMNGFELHNRRLKVGPPSSSSGGAVVNNTPPINPLVIAQQATLAGINPQLAFLQAQQQLNSTQPTPAPSGPKTRIYVGSIFFNLTQEHVQAVFESFGKIRSCQLIPNPDTGTHKGYGFIDFEEEKSATEAIEHMNGFDLCGRPLKVGWATNPVTQAAPGPAQTDPSKAAAPEEKETPQIDPTIPPSRCVRLSNMVDPAEEIDDDLPDEVKEECESFAPVEDVTSKVENGTTHVYVLFKDLEGGKTAVAKLHKRWFGGREILAQFHDEKDAMEKIFIDPEEDI